MPTLSREERLALVRYLCRDDQLCPSGSTTARHFAFNSFLSWTLRTCSHSWQQAQRWQTPGLFVAQADLAESPKPFVVVLYLMQCGTVLATVVPRQVPLARHPGAFPGAVTRAGEQGVLIEFAHWQVVAQWAELMVRSGPQHQTHLARRPVADDVELDVRRVS